jgi:hypothetical protein
MDSAWFIGLVIYELVLFATMHKLFPDRDITDVYANKVHPDVWPKWSKIAVVAFAGVIWYVTVPLAAAHYLGKRFIK